MVAVPNWLAAGLRVTVRLEPVPPNRILPFGMREGFEEAPDTMRLLAGVSTSPMMKLIGPSATSSLVTWSVIKLMIGVSLTGLMVRRKSLLTEAPSESVTIRVIVTEPFALGAGVTLMVRLEPPVPERTPRTIL